MSEVFAQIETYGLSRFLGATFAIVAAGLFIVAAAWPVLFPDPQRQKIDAIRKHRQAETRRLNASSRRGTYPKPQHEGIAPTPFVRMQRALERWWRRRRGHRRMIVAGVASGVGFAAGFAIHDTWFAIMLSSGVLGVAAWLFLTFLRRWLANRARQVFLRTLPDALDVMHLCVESGLNLDDALERTAHVLADTAPDIAVELMRAHDELQYLSDRSQALENLANRWDIPAVREVAMALSQSEQFGVALGNTLRILAVEDRRIRLSEAERRAAALPAKLSIPLIVFFLPVLFAVILTPAAIQIFNLP